MDCSTVCRSFRRREPPPLVVIWIEFPERRLPLAAEPQLGPRLLARLDPGRHEDVERLGLLQRVDELISQESHIIYEGGINVYFSLIGVHLVFLLLVKIQIFRERYTD